ncbi:MAG: methylcrotonoyl-CoA carboxylase, partial [Alphaproteobacteria bacterium]
MNVLHSDLDTSSRGFKENASRMRKLVEDLRVEVLKVGQGGGDAARSRHLERGKLLPRDRVDRLLDP